MNNYAHVFACHSEGARVRRAGGGRIEARSFLGRLPTAPHVLLLERVRSDGTFRFSSQTFSPASLIHGRFVSGHDLQTCRTERI